MDTTVVLLYDHMLMSNTMNNDMVGDVYMILRVLCIAVKLHSKRLWYWLTNDPRKHDDWY